MTITGNRVGATTSSTKRMLEDYAPAVPEGGEPADYAVELATVMMRKEEFEAVHSSAIATAAVVAASSSSSSASPSQSSPSRYVPSAPTAQLQVFVRMISDSKTLVIQASPRDLVKCIHDKIQMLAGIPLCEQRLIYRGKQLRWEQSLARCGIENDASLQLVGRMRSTRHLKSWQIVNDMISIIYRLSQGETVPNALKTIKTHLSECLSGTPKGSFSTARKHLQLFMSFSAPTALVILYMSPVKGNRKIAEKSIKHFLCLTKTKLRKHCRSICVPIVMKFCELLWGVPQYKKLYTSCWTCLSSLLETIWLLQTSKGFDWGARLTLVKGIFPFVSGPAQRLCRVLDSNIESAVDTELLRSDVNDFTVFLPYIYNAIKEHPRLECPISTPLPKKASFDLKFVQVVGDLYDIFESMLVKMNLCLIRMEKHLASNSTGEGDVFYQQSSQYLALLKELNAISKLYVGCQERFRTMLRLRHRSLCTLILRYVKQTDDSWWLLEHKDVINFEAKRHMVMMLFPEVVEDFEELHKILIDRSQLLAESFNFVSEANPESLHGSLFVQFKNEEANGLGVRREWFYLVCRAIFNQQNALFITCPNDCSRFYPNPASKVDPLSLKHFKFAGRMIALALRCKVQVGIVLDRTFFLQLAGLQVSLEDTREADPCLYSSCRKILEMDPDFIDSDALGLTFVREVEELGLRKVIELLPGGANLVVNSENRNEYVNLLVRHRFVSSISKQVSHFAEGFADILSSPRMLEFFFGSLDLEDLDSMLRGSTGDICVQDWKACTEYGGYEETDLQIVWFWEIVSKMTPKQKHELLFFWTSVKHLPAEGFRGLASRLRICMSPGPISHLPTSRTCFHLLYLPAYPSMSVMQDRLLVIAQEHVISSFGAS